MYRVELKGKTQDYWLLQEEEVPNVPCGVERNSCDDKPLAYTFRVPNVPCGVESGEREGT